LAQSGNNFFRDLAWRLAQLLGKFKAQRQRVFTQADVRRLVHHDPWQFHIILPLQKVANALDKLLLQLQVQVFAFAV
jgi:hypothetical protein